MYNKKALRDIVKNLGSAKAPTKKRDIIYDPMGQWTNPGQNTRVPTPNGDITMGANPETGQPIPFPVFAQPNVGPGVMMQPGQDYTFPGAEYVDEFPQVKKGGLVKQPKKYSKSLMAKNILFVKNALLSKKKSAKNKIFDPNSPYFQDGGYMDLDLDEEAIIKYKEGGYIVEELDNYAEGGEPCPEGQIFNPEIGECVPKWKAPNYEVNYDDGSHYSPVSKTISLNPDQLEQAGVENIKPIMEHEKFHHWQELQDRSRMSNSGIPLRMPSPVDNQEHDGPHYHNRRELEEEQKRKEILNSIGNPDFKFIPKDVVNDRLYYGSGKNTEDPTLLDAGSNELMYQDPTTLEGEARVYENDIRGGMPSMFGEFHKHKYGGLNKFTNGGEDISIPSLTRMDDGAQIKGSQGLNADFSTSLTAFINAAKADGIDLGIGSGFRTVEKQKQLWEQALKKYGTPEKARKWVAPPGRSNHNRGTAVDLNSSGAFLGKNKNTKATQWAHANAEKFGLHFRMGHEPWHIEPLNLSKEQKAKIDAEHQHSDNEDPNTHVDPNNAEALSKEGIDMTKYYKNLEKEPEITDIDNDYSNWNPQEEAVVDPRIAQLNAYSKLMSPSIQNVNDMYAATKVNQQQQQKQFAMGGYIDTELTDKEIANYKNGGYIVEYLD